MWKGASSLSLSNKIGVVRILPNLYPDIRTSVGWVSSFYDNHRIWVWDCFERPDLVLFLNYIFIFSRLGQGFKNLQNIISPRFQSASSVTWYQLVFVYRLLQILLFENLIFNVQFLKKIAQNKKILILFFSTFYMSTISSCSNEPSNSSNSFSKPKYVWINSTKLENSLHPSLGSLDQFFDCKWHLLRFVSMHVKEKIVSVLVCDLTMPKIWQAKKPTIGNMAPCFSYHCKWW